MKRANNVSIELSPQGRETR